MDATVSAIFDAMHTATDISCSRCKKSSVKHDTDEWMAAEEWKSEGWSLIYNPDVEHDEVCCPECTNKHKDEKEPK